MVRAMLARRGPRQDSGSVVVIAAVFMLVALLMLAAVVDLGNARATKRTVTLSTDAAALAAASTMDLTGMAVGVHDCSAVPTTSEERTIDPSNVDVEAVVEEYLAINGDATLAGSGACVVTVTRTGSGFVTVDADAIADYAFSRVVGQQSQEVSGSSSASVESGVGGGLRPVALCQVTQSGNTHQTVVDLLALANADGELASPLTLEFPIEKVADQPECGGGNGSGNFGQVDFVSGPNGTCYEGSFCDSLVNGYHGEVVEEWSSGNPGTNFNPYDDDVTALESAGAHFWVPVFDQASAGGDRTRLHLTYFAEVVPVTHTFTGRASSRNFTFTVFRIVPFDPSGPPTTEDAEPSAVRLCAVGGSTAAC